MLFLQNRKNEIISMKKAYNNYLYFSICYKMFSKKWRKRERGGRGEKETQRKTERSTIRKKEEIK